MAEKFSLYIHFPYCEKKCPYCDFNSHVTTRPLQAEAFFNAYRQELDWLKQHTHYQNIGSIFFGGGTPSLMPTDLCGKILDYAKQLWQIADGTEITLESNPSSTEIEKLRDFQQAGINRLSLGVQSFNDDKLQFLGRVHDAKTALNALDAVQKIFTSSSSSLSFSFDMIYASKGETLPQWQADLQQAMAFAPQHLSCYQLTIEPHTHFYKLAQLGKLNLPENADFMLHTIDYLQAQGLLAYEISNHAKAGSECQHNLNYWRGGDYAGIGPGAHGRITINGTDGRHSRHHTETIKSPDLWLKTLPEKPDAFTQYYPLSSFDNALEKLLMGLRLAEGVALTQQEFQQLIDVEKLQEEQALIQHMMQDDRHHLTLTDKGWLFLNHLLERITKDDIFE